MPPRVVQRLIALGMVCVLVCPPLQACPAVGNPASPWMSEEALAPLSVGAFHAHTEGPAAWICRSAPMPYSIDNDKDILAFLKKDERTPEDLLLWGFGYPEALAIVRVAKKFQEQTLDRFFVSYNRELDLKMSANASITEKVRIFFKDPHMNHSDTAQWEAIVAEAKELYGFAKSSLAKEVLQLSKSHRLMHVNSFQRNPISRQEFAQVVAKWQDYKRTIPPVSSKAAPKPALDSGLAFPEHLLEEFWKQPKSLSIKTVKLFLQNFHDFLVTKGALDRDSRVHKFYSAIYITRRMEFRSGLYDLVIDGKIVKMTDFIKQPMDIRVIPKVPNTGVRLLENAA
jgi:hypothetical protein